MPEDSPPPPPNVPPRRNILAAPQHVFTGFLQFIRERGVAGFAIGFILGGAAQKLVQALMDDIVNPLIGSTSGRFQTLTDFTVGALKIGDFISVTLNFLILCFVVYIVFKMLRLEGIDQPKK